MAEKMTWGKIFKKERKVKDELIKLLEKNRITAFELNTPEGINKEFNEYGILFAGSTVLKIWIKPKNRA